MKKTCCSKSVRREYTDGETVYRMLVWILSISEMSVTSRGYSIEYWIKLNWVQLKLHCLVFADVQVCLVITDQGWVQRFSDTVLVRFDIWFSSAISVHMFCQKKNNWLGVLPRWIYILGNCMGARFWDPCLWYSVNKHAWKQSQRLYTIKQISKITP